MFADIWAKRSKFDSTVLEKLKEKCQRETKFGRFANLTLWLLFKLIKKAKNFRSSNQSLIKTILGRSSSNQVLFSKTHAAHRLTTVENSWRKLLLIGEDSLSQCKKYRIEAKIEMLRQLGYEVYFFSGWSKSELAKANLPFCKTILFYRVPLFEKWKDFAQVAKTHGSRIIWEIDDLVFNPDVYSEHPYLQQCSAREREELLNGSKLFRSFLEFADEIIVSTDELCKEILLITE